MKDRDEVVADPAQPLGALPKKLAEEFGGLLQANGLTVEQLRGRWAGQPEQRVVEDLLMLQRILQKQSAEVYAALDRIQATLSTSLEQGGRNGLDDLLRDVSIPVKHAVRAAPEPGRTAMRSALTRVRDDCVRRAVEAGSVSWSHGLPDRYGVGMDERVIELPLAIEALRDESVGTALDAGAALNLEMVHERVLRPGLALVHLTQSAEKEDLAASGGKISYLFSDLRRLPFRDGWFDRVVCISTLEHVGMDNSRYGGSKEHEPESALVAAAELLRVTAPGGQLLLTVPSGTPRDLGWFRIFGPRDVVELTEVFAGHATEVRHFRYWDGWCEAEEPAAVEAGQTEMVLGMTALRVVKG